MQRRKLLQLLGTGVASAWVPRITFAGAGTDRRLVLVILRGAVDGLAVAAPLDDPDYVDTRGELAVASANALPLDGDFSLHPSLPWLQSEFRQHRALVVHAVATPYRARSHFDGQDMLENGGDGAMQRDGWLARAIGAGAGSGGRVAVAMAANLPLVLRGDTIHSTWAPSRLPDADDGTLERLRDLYADDPFFATRLEQALDTRQLAGAGETWRPGRRDAAAQRELMSVAARFLASDDGPRIAVVESGGWDTHANQGAESGSLANRLAVLDESLSALANGLGDHWRTTVVAVVTEFGRTVAINGTRGTDHGTGTVALLAGGAVAGGRVISDWPGLGRRDLLDGRDLKPTTDLRSVLKAVLGDHLGVARSALDDKVFPGSGKLAPLTGLVRA